ncbi:MAG: sigma-70 family RNA polymerase sigma factor [Candidatus Poribacteria bacterium]|nr:sigma-70 family RNA polymerase sigma factor [Candidatus Poribacteria bacterium]
MMRDNDAELIRRTLAGDETAFTLLVKKYRKHVHTLAWHKIGDFHIAEDITQETFLQVYRDLATLREPDRFPGWLYVVTNHRCIAWFRKNQLHVRLMEGINMAMKGEAAYSRYVADEQAKTETEAQQKVVKQLLAKLQESERTVMTLYYFGEMTCEEISKFLGVSANTIKSRLSRARQRLKKEEPIIREALDSFQLSANLTENIVREIAHIKPVAPSRGKPLVPWAIATSTAILVVMMLGVSNQYLARFQRPYSFDTTSEMTVELIEAPIVIDLPSKPDVRNQVGRSGKGIGAGPKDSETPTVAQPTNQTRTLTQEQQKNIEICRQNLLIISEAIHAYQKEYGDLPEWLSDLHPQYLPDANILICPADTNGGKAGYPLNVDPKMSVSYGYEFNPEYRTYKSRQRLVYGDDMPLVRCRHHANDDFQCLNLSLSSKIYESTNVWEYSPQDMYGSSETAITTLEETLEKHPDNVHFYELYPLLVSLYIEVGNEPAVDALIERFKLVMKPNIAGYITLCNMLQVIGRYEDMLAVVKAAERQNPGNIFIPGLFAYIYEKLGDTELAKSYESNADLLHGLIGKPAPDFSAIDLNGDSIALQDYRGKVVLLNFWTMWSSLGLTKMPYLKKVYDTYKDEGFDIIGISPDDDEPKFRNYIQENDIPWRQILDNVAGKNSIARQYAIRGIPAIRLIDREGKLITHEARRMDLEKFVAEALKNKSKD